LGASNVNPVKIGNNAFTSRRNAVLLTAGLASAVGLKYYTDGPVFSEPVDLQGFNVVITGANTGLGKATAMKLAALHANVVMLVKTVSKGEAACKEIRSAVPGATVSALQIDLASLKSIAACSEELAKLLGKQGIDVLVNNAGVMAIPSRTTTEDGFETHLGVNHLGHFALTASLFSLLKKGGKGKGARIINVSSAAHTLGHLDFENLMFEREGSYQPWPAYGNSKLANVLFTRELDRRLRAKGSNILAVSCHPGLCRTDLGRYLFDPASVPKYLAPLAGAALAPLGTCEQK
jgi:NAD(P)-dependent dehydrogenase (short-subunit alcohol dehydrogenase family)